MAVASAMTEHPAERQEKEQREEKEVAAADQEHQCREQQPIDGEAHPRARADWVAV